MDMYKTFSAHQSNQQAPCASLNRLVYFSSMLLKYATVHAWTLMCMAGHAVICMLCCGFLMHWWLCRLNWVVLTAWNVGCLPLALVIAAVKARHRVSSKLKAQDHSTADEEVGGGAHSMVGSSNQRSDNGLQQLGDVALLGA